MPIARGAIIKGLRERRPDKDLDTWDNWTQDQLWQIYQKEVCKIDENHEDFTTHYREPICNVDSKNHPDHPDYEEPTGEDIFPDSINQP